MLEFPQLADMMRLRRMMRMSRVTSLIRMQMHSSTLRMCLSSRTQLEAMCLTRGEMHLLHADLLPLLDGCFGPLLV